MSDILTMIQNAEKEIEDALEAYEINDQNEQALAVYEKIEKELEDLAVSPDDPDYPAQQNVLAYCLMRKGNMLRALGRSQEANELSRREIAAARASKNDLTLARSLMSLGATAFQQRNIAQGTQYLEEARASFEKGDSYDYRQGVGWCWILQSDLLNIGLLPGGPGEVIETAGRALDILLPIENWPGIARAYAARAQAHEKSGHEAEAKADREAQSHYEELIRTQGIGPAQ